MAINNILNVADNLMTVIDNAVDKKINNLPVSIPCQVIKRSDITVTVQSLLQYPVPSLPIEEVPIVKSKYYNYPVMAGDIGLLIPISFAFSQATKGILAIEPIKTVSMQNYCFLPLTKVSEETQATTSTELTSQSGQNKLLLSDDTFSVDLSGQAKEEMKSDSLSIDIGGQGKLTVKADSFEVDIGGQGKLTVKGDEGSLVIGQKKIEFSSSGVTLTDGTNKIEIGSSVLTISAGANKIELGASGVNINNALTVLP